MTDADGKGVRRPDFSHSAWSALTHEEAVRAEGARYRPARLSERPQLSEREAACQPQRATDETAQREGVVVCLDKARPGRVRRTRAVSLRQGDLFK